MRICAVVVFFEPTKACIQNINSYINDVEKVIIIDNSSKDNNNLFIGKSTRLLEKIEYEALFENRGLATALNIGCKKAYDYGFDYVLTMDQDSYFDVGSLDKMINFAKKDKVKQYSIISPNVRSLFFDETAGVEKEAYIQYDRFKNTKRNWTMTSGSLMNLYDFIKVNGFDDSMFIAHLDIDLGIKINKINKKIIVIGNSIINQHFGNSRPRRILWKKVHPSFANPVRTYYLFRNQKYLEIKYGEEIKKFINVNLFKFIIKITLFEDKKLAKYKMMYQGIKDAKNGEMGAYKSNG